MARIDMNSWRSACVYDTPRHRDASAASLLRCCDSSLLSPLGVFTVVTAVTTPIYGGSWHTYRTGGALLFLNGYIATPAQRPAAVIPAGRKPQRFLTMRVYHAHCRFRIRRLSHPSRPHLDLKHQSHCSLNPMRISTSHCALLGSVPALCARTFPAPSAVLPPHHLSLPSYLSSSLHLVPSHRSREALQRQTRSCATLSRSLLCSCLVLPYLLLVHSTSRSFRCIILRTLGFTRP
ncbi:hypothetical protein K438DRAFT_1972778 [Mycena galopus ATCC 62051]|nr:hypothetical protein K438DRAFT_1972778 [Mycena galopus ATCC 62051]